MLSSERHSRNRHINLYTTLVWVILNDKVGFFKFSIINNEFYLFLSFGEFNVSVYNVGFNCSSTL